MCVGSTMTMNVSHISLFTKERELKSYQESLKNFYDTSEHFNLYRTLLIRVKLKA